MPLSSKPAEPRVVIVHNIVSPYKVVLFNHLVHLFPELHVLYLASTESIRSWTVPVSDIRHPYTVLAPGSLNDQSKVALSFKVWRELSDKNPSIVVLAEYIHPAYWIALLWCRTHRKRAVFLCESTRDDRPRSAWKERIKQLFVRRCTAGIAQGTNTSHYLNSLGMTPDRIRIKGYSTDNEVYTRGANEARQRRAELQTKYGAAPHNFLFVGRFAPEKNIETLLKAFDSICRDFPDWGLLLVGGGPLETRYREIIEDLTIPRVSVIPFLQKSELPAIYGIADVFVLPSLSEPWGLVVNEAMAASLPVIASQKCGSTADLITHGKTGFSFVPTDPTRLADLMRMLASDPELRRSIGTAAFEKIGEYSSERSAERMGEAIRYAMTLPIP
ncbi:glycosyltransferase family 1 protein [bacterium]|nr:glycosyltransferase family 1 protein [bacterium]